MSADGIEVYDLVLSDFHLRFTEVISLWTIFITNDILIFRKSIGILTSISFSCSQF